MPNVTLLGAADDGTFPGRVGASLTTKITAAAARSAAPAHDAELRRLATDRTASWSDPGGWRARGLTRAGRRLVGVKHDTTAGLAVGYSDDDGVTWVQAYQFAPATGTVADALLVTNDGEVIVTVRTTAGDYDAKLYRSTGFDTNPATATWAVVFDTPFAQSATGPSGIYRGLAYDGADAVAGAWYDKKTLNGATVYGADAGVRVRASTNKGVTWAEVFNLRDWLTAQGVAPDAYGYHVHSISFDPFSDGWVLSYGDTNGGSGQTGVLHFTRDFATVTVVYRGTGPWQCVSLYPVADAILGLGDGGASGGVNRFPRLEAGGFGAPEKAYDLVNGIGTCGYQATPGGLTLLPVTQISGTTPLSRLLATVDGRTVRELHVDTGYTVSGVNGIQFAVGPTATGKIIAVSNNDGRYTGGVAQLTVAAARPATETAISAQRAAPGRRWAFLGDSITNGSSASNYAYSFLPLACEMTGTLFATASLIESGVPGQRVKQMADRVETTLDAGAEGLVVLAGTNDAGRNDIGTATPLAEYQADYQRIVDAAHRRGVPVIVCTVPPRAADPAPQPHTFAAIEQYNMWLRMWAPSQGAYLADVNAALVDPATGQLAAENFAAGDGTHPTDKGHYKMAVVVSEAMRKASQERLDSRLVWAKTAVSLNANPLMATTTGVRPTSYYEQPGSPGDAPVYTVVPDTRGYLKAGNWAQVDFAPGAVNGNRNLAITIPAGGWAVGDRLAVTGVMEVDDISGGWAAGLGVNTGAGITYSTASVMVQNQSGSPMPGASWTRNPGRRRPGTNTYELGPFFFSFVVPAGTTAMLLWARMAIPAGHRLVMRVGATDVINLTTLGLSVPDTGFISVP